MSHAHRLAFIEANRSRLHGPYLEIGSKDYGTAPSLRQAFAGESYVGVDMLAGKDVDVVVDLTGPPQEIDAALGGQRFGTILCLAVLEHCAQPFRMAENLTRLLNPGGALYVTAPFAWKRHAYPSDYWRFTPEAIRLLFPDITFDMDAARLTTAARDLQPLGEDLGRIRLSTSECLKQKRYGRALSVAILKGLRKVGLLGWLLGGAYLLPPVMVHMVGVKSR